MLGYHGLILNVWLQVCWEYFLSEKFSITLPAEGDKIVYEW